MKDYSRVFIYIIFFSSIFYSCANRVTPTGGVKDVKPPVVDTIQPDNYAVNFNSRKVEIKFDEYVQLRDLQKQLIVSPLMDPPPVIVVKKKSVIIDLPKTLESNTTYTVNLGNAIADIHEGNGIESFRYVFSTGPVLDSLYIKGTAVDAYKQKGEKGIAILLYKTTDDSLPLKSKPDYYARTNENGEFILANIGAGNYMIVAVNDKNGNYKCDSPQQEAISMNKSVSPDTNVANLSYFTELPSELYIKKVNYISEKKWSILMNRPSDASSLRPLNESQPLYLESWNHNRDTVLLWCADTIKDTLSIQLMNNNQIVDTARIRLKVPASSRGRGGEAMGALKKNFIESTNVINGLRPFSNPELILNNPIKNILPQNFLLTADSLPISDFKLGFNDSLHRKLAIAYQWKEGNSYKLTMLPGALTDFAGTINDTMVILFAAMVSDELGSLQLILSNLPSGNLVLQLRKEQGAIVRQLKINADGRYEFKALDPGKYGVAILIDGNGNGRWDTGNYGAKVSPELIYYFKGEISVRANWEMEQEWKIEH